MAKKKKQRLDKTQNREYRIKNNKLKWTNSLQNTNFTTAVLQTHNVTSQIERKQTLKPEAQEFMMPYGTSENFGEDEKHKILLYFSLLILLIRCRGRQENAK